MVWVGREKRTRLWDVNVPGGFGAAGGGPGSTMGNVISMQCQHEFMHIFKQVLDYLLYIIYYTFNKNVSSTFFPDQPGILVLELFFFC